MIIIPNLAEGEKSGLYSIKLNGMEAFARQIYVSAIPYNAGWPGYQRPTNQAEESAYLSYEADEPVTLTVMPSKDFNEVVLRPMSEKIKVERNGNSVSFTPPALTVLLVRLMRVISSSSRGPFSARRSKATDTRSVKSCRFASSPWRM